MAYYVIKLPNAIPQELFANLAGDVSADLRRKISHDYSRIEKLAETSAPTSRKAITQVFFRQLADKRKARTLSRIFANTAGQYVFSVPEKGHSDAETGKRLSRDTADTFQKMELALNIAEARCCRPEDCYGDAVRMVNLYNRNSPR